MYELIDKVRRRPAMYIGHASPTHLYSFLSGFELGVKPEEKPQLNAAFNDWVAVKLGYYESTSGWAHMIEDQRDDKEEALWLFFELLDEFRGIRHEILKTAKYSSAQAIDNNLYYRRRKVRGTFELLIKPDQADLRLQK